ncbi:MAG TPA: flavodoxin reductase [Sphingobacteriaceae bacterium]|nr:flavodoxin reductase [Sphingobacteriaceae bacterium]
MSAHIVKVLESNFLTHNIKRFVLEKPSGYTFISGQATDVSINKPGQEEELRPFTFTSVNGSDYLEFTIKIYKGHNGVTEKLTEINAGDELIVHDVFGTITYQGPGLFIAGGAGITPFISIFRQLKLDNLLYGNSLLFANRNVDDIILRDELNEMLGGSYFDIIEEQGYGIYKQIIDIRLLKQYVDGVRKYYYICGPDKFTLSMIGHLKDLGVDESFIIYEK